MKRLLIAIAVLAIPPTATAHRLDEYLQATRVSIDVDRVDLEIDLTAGTAIAKGTGIPAVSRPRNRIVTIRI